jgi:hypothetical protein
MKFPIKTSQQNGTKCHLCNHIATFTFGDSDCQETQIQEAAHKKEKIRLCCKNWWWFGRSGSFRYQLGLKKVKVPTPTVDPEL